MPIALFKKKNENVERISFKDFSDFRARGYGKKVSVSIDDKTYILAPDVTAAQFSTWTQAAENAPAASQESALPPTAEAKVPSPFLTAKPAGGPGPAPAKSSASQDVARSLEEIRERLEKLTASVEEFRARTPEGAEAAVRDRLEGALSEKASGFATALERSQRDAARQLGDLKSEILAEVERLADAADENRLTNEQRRKLFAEYRPGTIEEQRQRIESLRAELERSEKKNFDLLQDLQRLNLDLLGYKNDPSRVALATLKERELQLDQRQKDVEGAEAVKVERNALFRRVNELEKLRDTYEANQSVLRQDERARVEVADLRKQLAEMESVRSEAEPLRDALTAERKKRMELVTTVSQQAEKLQGLQEDLLKAKAEAGERLAAVVEREKAHARREKELEADFKREEATIRAAETRRTQWLEDRKKSLEEESAKLKEVAERHAQERYLKEHRQLSFDRDQAIKERSHFQSRLDAAEKELVSARQQKLEFESRREALQTELRSLQAKLEAQRHELDDLEDEHRMAKEAKSGVQAELEAVRARVAEERDAHEKALQRQNSELSALEQRRLAIEQRTVDRPSRLKPVAEPWGVRRHLEVAGREEAAWLGDVRQRIASAGFSFPSRVLNAFHTSLKISDWAPLTGLAGVSGTGKSELPRL